MIKKNRYYAKQFLNAFPTFAKLSFWKKFLKYILLFAVIYLVIKLIELVIIGLLFIISNEF